MTDREKMIQIIDAWEWDDSFQPKGFIPNADLADRLIEAGFGRVGTGGVPFLNQWTCLYCGKDVNGEYHDCKRGTAR